MSKVDMPRTIHAPALQARMGTWTYYVSAIKFKDVASRVRNSGAIHQSEDLSHYLQRRLTERSKDISDYIKSQPQRFFNTIVIGVYGGNPDWRELKLRPYLDDDDDIVEDTEGVFGILTLHPDTKLWAIDGQHRVSGIQEALRTSPELGEDRVSVIFVSGVASEVRSKDEEGYQRTRRLFTTLNKHAKAVAKKDVIALDEDDVVAIVVRRLLNEYELFHGKINIEDEGSSLPSSDKTSFTIIITLYDVLNDFLRGTRNNNSWKKFKLLRPSDVEIEAFYQEAVGLMNSLKENFSPLKEVLEGPIGVELAARYRNEKGGHLIFRPIGLQIIVSAVSFLMQQYDQENHGDSHESLNRAVSDIAALPMELSEVPWKNLLWDNKKNRVIFAAENRKTAYYTLIFLAGADLSQLKRRHPLTKDALMKEYAEIPGMEESDVSKVFS